MFQDSFLPLQYQQFFKERIDLLLVCFCCFFQFCKLLHLYHLLHLYCFLGFRMWRGFRFYHVFFECAHLSFKSGILSRKRSTELRKLCDIFLCFRHVFFHRLSGCHFFFERFLKISIRLDHKHLSVKSSRSGHSHRTNGIICQFLHTRDRLVGSRSGEKTECRKTRRTHHLSNPWTETQNRINRFFDRITKPFDYGSMYLIGAAPR